MAINLVSAPFGLKRLSDCIEYEFNLTNIGDGVNVEKRLAYQLFCIDNGQAKEVTKIKHFTPKSTDNFTIRFKNSIINALCTPLPLGTSTGAGSVDVGLPSQGFKKQFFLQYSEVTINLNDCENLVTTADTTSTFPFTALNSVNNDYENASLNTGEISYLTSKPSIICLCESTKDFIYICNNTGSTIPYTIKFYSEDFSSGCAEFTPAPLPSDEILVIGVGVGNLYPNGLPTFADITKYEINLPNYTYTVLIDKEKCKEYLNVYFQEKQGGYSGLCFSYDDSSVTTTSDLYCFSDGKCTAHNSKENLLINTDLIYNKDSKLKLTLSCEIPFNLSNSRWINNFLTSKSYYIDFVDVDGETYQQNLIINDGDYKTFKKDDCTVLKITAYVDLCKNSPNSKRRII